MYCRATVLVQYILYIPTSIAKNNTMSLHRAGGTVGQNRTCVPPTDVTRTTPERGGSVWYTHTYGPILSKRACLLGGIHSRRHGHDGYSHRLNNPTYPSCTDPRNHKEREETEKLGGVLGEDARASERWRSDAFGKTAMSFSGLKQKCSGIKQCIRQRYFE